MKNPVIQDLLGVVNGVNTIFETSVEYRPGSVFIFRNGMLGSPLLTDGWDELGGKRIRMKEAPKTTDILQVRFIPR